MTILVLFILNIKLERSILDINSANISPMIYNSQNTQTLILQILQPILYDTYSQPAPQHRPIPIYPTPPPLQSTTILNNLIPPLKSTTNITQSHPTAVHHQYKPNPLRTTANITPTPSHYKEQQIFNNSLYFSSVFDLIKCFCCTVFICGVLFGMDVML